MKKIFAIDWILIVVFILSAFSGIELHCAGHGNNHGLCHNKAALHILTSSLFLITAISHIATHWGWYKAVGINGIGKRDKTTAVLSVMFMLVSVTGIVLLGINTRHSYIGLWHYRIGIATIGLSAWHIIKRAHLLRKSLNTPKHRHI